MNAIAPTQGIDRAYRNAMAYRDALAKKINTLSQEIDSLRRDLGRVDVFLDQWQRFAANDVSPPVDGEFSNNAPVDNLDSTQVTQAPKARRNSKKEEVAAVARELIEAAGKPLSREELYPLLLERGLVIEGGDPLMVLSTMLWRTKEAVRIVRLRGGGYWLAERQYQPAGYYPVTVLVSGDQRTPYHLVPDGDASIDNSKPEGLLEEDEF